MSRSKLAIFVVAWVLASLAIGVVTAILLTEVLSLFGLVESGKSSYSASLNVITLVVFVVLITVPIVFRKRFLDEGADLES